MGLCCFSIEKCVAFHVHSSLPSTAQLLEPFCREHDIRVFGDIERPAAASHPVNAMHQTGGVVVTSDIEDPPGLYEKVQLPLTHFYVSILLSLVLPAGGVSTV